MSSFVWTDKGSSIHISRLYVPDETRCGWPTVGEVDAGDVIYRWDAICKRCRTNIEKEMERMVGAA